MLAVTIRSQVETVGLMETASALAQQFGFPHQFVDFNKLEDKAYVENSPNRCYVCKSADLTVIIEIAQKAGIQHVLLGTNADDLSEYRPGLRAAAELSVLSPLAEARLNKREISHPGPPTGPGKLEPSLVALPGLQNSVRYPGYQRKTRTDRPG